MIRFIYKAGLYPTTMQSCFREYDKNMFQNVKDNFIFKFNLESDPYNNIDISNNQNLEFFLNFSAYAIIDKEQNYVCDLCFDNLSDFVWILQMYNVDGVEFEIPENVYKICEKDFKLYSDRIIKKED